MKDNQQSKKDFYDIFKYTVVLFIAFVVINFLLTKFVIVKCSVSGISMQPTFENQERVIAYRHSELKHYSDTGNFSIRSLATKKDYKKIYTTAQLNLMRKTNKVPKDSYFVLGDHRSVSKDSRYIGAIPRSKIEGVVKVRYWPLNRLSLY